MCLYLLFSKLTLRALMRFFMWPFYTQIMYSSPISILCMKIAFVVLDGVGVSVVLVHLFICFFTLHFIEIVVLPYNFQRDQVGNDIVIVRWHTHKIFILNTLHSIHHSTARSDKDTSCLVFVSISPVFISSFFS